MTPPHYVTPYMSRRTGVSILPLHPGSCACTVFRACDATGLRDRHPHRRGLQSRPRCSPHVEHELGIYSQGVRRGPHAQTLTKTREKSERFAARSRAADLRKPDGGHGSTALLCRMGTSFTVASYFFRRRPNVVLGSSA